MPDWHDVVRARLAETGIDPTIDNALVDELAQHLEDRYWSSLAQGASEGDAHAIAMGELDGCEGGVADLVKHRLPPETLIPGEPSIASVGRGGHPLRQLNRDFVYAWRRLRQAPLFSLFAVATLAAPEAALVLGPGAVIYPPKLLQEISDAKVTADRLSIDPQAMIIEDADREFEANTLKKTIASTGQGVGVATARKVMRGAYPGGPPVRLARDLDELKPYVRATRPILEALFGRGAKVFLEGTQGTGLSIHHGEYNWVTSRDTTVSGCLADAGIAPSRVRRIVMVCRAYPIRVQNPDEAGEHSGPMGKEISWDLVAERSGIDIAELLKTERTTTTDRRRRVAEFSWDLLRHATSLNGPTDVALSFSDYVSRANKSARRFEQLTSETIQFIEEVERVACAPVALISTRFEKRGIIDRRRWS